MQVLLLDEITVDLDVLGRADLMRFLVEECDSRGATIIYATHIFDGLEFWPSHVAYVARGKRNMLMGVTRIAWEPELKQRIVWPSWCAAAWLRLALDQVWGNAALLPGACLELIASVAAAVCAVFVSLLQASCSSVSLRAASLSWLKVICLSWWCSC